LRLTYVSLIKSYSIPGGWGENVRVSAFKYRAFLSCSAADTAWGDWLQTALEGFRIDEALVGLETLAGPVPRILGPVFRSEHGSPRTPADERRRAALHASQFLIVLCSPSAAKDASIDEEIRRFTAIGRADRIVPVLVGGRRGDAELQSIPRELQFRFGPDGLWRNPRGYPAWSDARPGGEGKEAALSQVVAGLVGLSRSDIEQAAAAERRRKTIASRSIAAGLLGLCLACNYGFLFARHELSRNEALLEGAASGLDALTRAAATAINFAGVPPRFSLTFAEITEDLFRRTFDVGTETAPLTFNRAVMLIDVARLEMRRSRAEGEHGRAGEVELLLNKIAATHRHDPHWQRRLAVAYHRLGDLLQDQGSLNEAARSYERSRRIVEYLAALPKHAPRQRELAALNLKIGDIEFARGFFDEAIVKYDQHLDIVSGLATQEPGKTAWQHALVRSHIRIGDVLRLQGNLEEALASYAAGYAVAQRLAAREGGEEQQALATVYFKIADVLTLQERFDEALSSYRLSNAIVQSLLAANPHDFGWLHELGITHNRIAWISEARGDFNAALAEYRTVLALAGRLATADADNTSVQWNLGFAHGRIGDILLSTGDVAGALRAYEAKREVMDRLADRESDNLAWQHERGISHARLALVLESRGNLAAAKAEYEICVTIARRVAAASRENPQIQHNLAVAHGKLAEVLHRLGNSTQALAQFRQARQITATLLEVEATAALSDELARFDSRINALQGHAQSRIGSPVVPASGYASASSTGPASPAKTETSQPGKDANKPGSY
jgi:tetratricopeptide (TPR) repeat protein